MTIIVLLILASVAISLTIGQNGILSRAKDAVEKYEEASTNEQNELNKVTDLMGEYFNENQGEDNDGEYNTAKTVVEAIKQNKPYENDESIVDSSEPANWVRVPAGFKVSQESATKVEDGIVIEDSDGNQFVWIPVNTAINTTLGNKTIKYERTSFDNSDIVTDFIETMPRDEEQSIEANGGFYIGRYEAGDAVSKTMRPIGSSQENKVSIKKNQVPYNNVTQANAKKNS